MLFEGRHAAEHALVNETRETPLKGFLHLGTGLMNELPDMVQDRTSKFSRPGNVSIDSCIFLSHRIYLPVLSTLICLNLAIGHPWLTALLCEGSPLPSLAAPFSS